MSDFDTVTGCRSATCYCGNPLKPYAKSTSRRSDRSCSRTTAPSCGGSPQLTKRLASDEIDGKLHDVRLVLEYVNNKEVFARYNYTHLSRRLILELVADQEKEESIVNKFRNSFNLLAGSGNVGQILLTDCDPISPKSFTDWTLPWVNQEFSVVKNDKPQPRGHEAQPDRPSANEGHEDVIREFRVQETIEKIMKMRKQLHQAQLQTELAETLKHMFLPSRKHIKEQTEPLVEQQFLSSSVHSQSAAS